MSWLTSSQIISLHLSFTFFIRRSNAERVAVRPLNFRICLKFKSVPPFLPDYCLLCTFQCMSPMCPPSRSRRRSMLLSNLSCDNSSQLPKRVGEHLVMLDLGTKLNPRWHVLSLPWSTKLVQLSYKLTSYSYLAKIIAGRSNHHSRTPLLQICPYFLLIELLHLVLPKMR